MNVITTTPTSVKITPRYNQTSTTDYTLTLVNESTKVESTINVVGWTVADYTTNNGQIVVTFADTYSEGDEYSFKMVDGSDNIVKRGKFFVTDQTPQNYSINE